MALVDAPSDARNAVTVVPILSPRTSPAAVSKVIVPAIARAIVMNPKYLFCDEPNSGLDPKTAIVIDNLIQEITDEYQMITIINSHDMNSVMEIGEKIIFLKQGLKEWEGTYKTIFKTDNKAVTDFVYSSNLYKKVREVYNKEA